VVVDYSQISSRPGVADSAEFGWRISRALQYLADGADLAVGPGLQPLVEAGPAEQVTTLHITRPFFTHNKKRLF